MQLLEILTKVRYFLTLQLFLHNNLIFATIYKQRPNFLILDEPTNDLDLDTLTALESYLDEFQGVLVVVSHDVYFTDKVTNHLFVFEGDGLIKDYVGTLSEYAECLIDLEQGTHGKQSNVLDVDNKTVLSKEDKKTRTEKRNLIKKLEREIEKIESDIQKLKLKRDTIQVEMDRSVDKGWSVLAELSNQLTMIDEDIENKETRWLELSEQLESESSSVE